MEDLQLQDLRRSERAVTGIFLAVTLAFAVSGCQVKDNSGLEPTAVTVQELFSLVETGQPVYLLDVRTVPEFHDSRLSFTDMLIPYDSISQYLKELPEDKSTPIYTFCRTGRRSDVAAHFLRMVGYRHVYNVTGGIVAWKEAGYPTVSGPTE